MATRITRDQIVSYLNTTPDSTATWALLGLGVSEYAIEMNPQTETSKWIIDKNSTTELTSYQMQGSVTQKCYFGDEIYDFVNELRRNEAVGASAKSQVLDIDIYDSQESGGSTTYAATLHDCIVTVSSYGGEDAELSYDIYYNGDGKLGTVTITDGVPTFTETP